MMQIINEYLKKFYHFYKYFAKSNEKEENQAHNQMDHPANSRQKSLDGADCSGASSLESNPRSPNSGSGVNSIYNNLSVYREILQAKKGNR